MNGNWDKVSSQEFAIARDDFINALGIQRKMHFRLMFGSLKFPAKGP